MNYRSVTLFHGDVERESYKALFGGGKEAWEVRGRFQLLLLKCRGLQPHHRLLDVGCGVLRGGVHFITYLNRGNYHGVDYNKSFIKVARSLVEANSELKAKKPSLSFDEHFGFINTLPSNDFILAFSVLNHCDTHQKRVFFSRLSKGLSAEGKAHITHAGWFTQGLLSGSDLKVGFLRESSDIEPSLSLEKWGWPSTESIFPILEVSRVGSPDLPLAL